MNTKLTLTIEQDVIERAKKYAKGENRSLSDIIENYLMYLTARDRASEPKSTPTVTLLKGAFKMPKDFDYNKELALRREKKYL
jgi:hypothetical protein